MQSRQKSYTNVRRRILELEEWDLVFLKVAPMKGVLRFRHKGKLSPHFIKPFKILERIGSVSYKLALPPSLSSIHDVFHVSMLIKYITDHTHVIDYRPLEIKEDLGYYEKPNNVTEKFVWRGNPSRIKIAEETLLEENENRRAEEN